MALQPQPSNWPLRITHMIQTSRSTGAASATTNIQLQRSVAITEDGEEAALVRALLHLWLWVGAAGRVSARRAISPIDRQLLTQRS